MSRLVAFTLAAHRALQRLRAPHVRRRFDAEERLVLTEDLTRRRREAGRLAVLAQWPALLRDGLADAVTTRRVSPRDTLARRAADLGLAALLTVPALLFVGVAAAAVYVPSGGPVLVEVAYRGRGGQPLRLRKLRTMTVEDPRQITRLGRVLRATRLDETPTLLALARGDVTLHGPRAQPVASGEAPLGVRPGLLSPPPH
jgi:Bacterial sugar transferase